MKILIVIAIIAAVAFWLGRMTRRSQPPVGEQPRQIPTRKDPGSAQAAQRVASLPSRIRADLDVLLRAGNKINAIKLVKESTDYGLKESKEIVDERERQLGL